MNNVGWGFRKRQGLEVVQEALHGCGEALLVLGYHDVAEHLRHLARRRLVGGPGLLSKLRPVGIGDFRLQVPHPVGQAAPACGAREHSSTARISPGAPSVATKSGSPRPRRFRSWKNARQLSVSSFVPGERCSSTFCPSTVISPRRTARPRGAGLRGAARRCRP